VKLQDLPLSELARWLRNKFVLERGMVPPSSIPVFGIDHAIGGVQVAPLAAANVTLSATTGSWTLLTPATYSFQVTVSGLRDVWIIGSGTAVQSGASSVHALGVTIDGLDYQRAVHVGTAVTNNGLALIIGLTHWNFVGRLRAGTLPRGTYTINLASRCASGVNTGLLFAGGGNVVNLYAVEY
jgi:hypothetical protein